MSEHPNGMRVRDLIGELQDLDPDALVLIEIDVTVVGPTSIYGDESGRVVTITGDTSRLEDEQP